MLKVALWTLIGGSVNFFCLREADPYVAPKLMFMCAGVFMLWAMAVWWGRSLPVTDMDGPIVTWIGALILTTAFSIDIPSSILGPRQGQFLCLMSALICTLAYYGTATNRPFLNYFTIERIFLISTLLMAVYAVIQGVLHRDPLTAFVMPQGRVTSTMGSPLYTGALLALSMPIALRLALAHARQDWELGMLALTVQSLALWYTWSRGAWIAAAIGCAVYLAGSKRIRWTMVILAAFACLAAVPLLWIHGRDAQRIEIWRIAWRSFLEHPWLGSGPETFLLEFRRLMTIRYISILKNSTAVQAHAHMDLLQVASTMGIVGLTAYLWLSARALMRVYASRRETAALGIAAALFVQLKFNPVPLSCFVIFAVLLGALCEAA